jgi:hypothetical protein
MKRVWSVFALALILMFLAAPAVMADDNTGNLVGGGIGCCCSVIWLGVVGYCAYFAYTDATARGANGLVWALITFFGCFPIGFIVYFVTRPEKKGPPA